MPKNQKQKRKRTTTKKKKRTYGVDDAAITALDMLQSQARSGVEKLEDFADASEGGVSIISTVKALEGQVETVFKLNEILQAQLDETQKKLSEELGSRVQSDAQAARRIILFLQRRLKKELRMSGTP